jgi:hypothetical protein
MVTGTLPKANAACKRGSRTKQRQTGVAVAAERSGALILCDIAWSGEMEGAFGKVVEILGKA